MGILIQMIPTSETNSLFIYGITVKEEIVFRTTYNPQQLRKEKMTIHEGVCFIGTYQFSANALIRLPNDL